VVTGLNYENESVSLGQTYAFRAQTQEEAWQRRQKYRQALGLDMPEEIAAGWKAVQQFSKKGPAWGGCSPG